MSGRQPYDFALAAAEAAQAAAEAQRREVELARLKAERLASIHAERLAISRENERLRSALLGSQARALEGQQAALDALAGRAQAAGFTLSSLESQIQASAVELERARAELHLQMDRLAGLERAARLQEAAVTATLAEAHETLGRVEGLQSANAETLAALVDAFTAGRASGAVQSGLEERIRQLEAEVAFVTQRADLSPVAMVTLQVMESNGYRLQGTLGREEMIVYFQKEGAAHQIAVRMAPVTRSGEEVQRWDLLAETLDIEGETCFGELDDFETGMEEVGVGRLQRKEGRVCPRPDSEALLPRLPESRKLWKKTFREDSRTKGTA